VESRIHCACNALSKMPEFSRSLNFRCVLLISLITTLLLVYGEIPWPRVSRLSDQEMKALMIDVVNKTYRALIVLFDDQLGSELIKILVQQDLVPRRNEPTKRWIPFLRMTAVVER
jgi:hypothetical protein